MCFEKWDNFWHQIKKVDPKPFKVSLWKNWEFYLIYGTKLNTKFETNAFEIDKVNMMFKIIYMLKVEHIMIIICKKQWKWINIFTKLIWF